MAIIFSLTLMYLWDKPVYRILLSGVNTILLLAMLLTRSRGGYIVGFSAIFLFFIIQAKGYRFKTFGSFFCSAVPAFLFMQKVSDQTASRDAKTLTKLLIISFMAAVLLAILQESVILLFSKIMKKHSPPKALSRIIHLAVCLHNCFHIPLWDRIIALFPENIIDRFLKMNMSERSVYIRTEFFQDAFKLISKNWLFVWAAVAGRFCIMVFRNPIISAEPCIITI